MTAGPKPRKIQEYPRFFRAAGQNPGDIRAKIAANGRLADRMPASRAVRLERSDWHRNYGRTN